MNAEPITRPALRFHGGKYKLAPWIISMMPEHRTYVEAYGGACSVLLRKPRARAEIYNDLDFEVVNVFRVLQDLRTAEELRRLLALTPFARSSALYEELYGDWVRLDRKHMADGARPRIESVWLNPACAERQTQQVLEL